MTTELKKLQAKLAELMEEVAALTGESEVKTVSRPRDSKGRFLPKGAKTVKSKVEPTIITPTTVTPPALAMALAGAEVGQTVRISGMSKRDVNKLVSGSGGTWQAGSWKDGVNSTYQVDGRQFTFDNVKVWKQEALGRERGMTRTA